MAPRCVQWYSWAPGTGEDTDGYAPRRIAVSGAVPRRIVVIGATPGRTIVCVAV